MKRLKPLIALSLLAASFGVTADSFIRVVNNSSKPLQAIWQAGLCNKMFDDWTGDVQLTGCDLVVLGPGEEEKYEFGIFHSDRSVKVFDQEKGRIAYCNSMDYASVTVSDGENDSFNVEYTCP